MTHVTGPPRAAVWLLEHLLNAPSAEAIVGDLTEDFERIASRSGSGRARLWFWRQAVVSVLWRWRGRPRSSFSLRRRLTMHTFGTEGRQAARALRRSPGFSLAAVVPLALAIALATSVFAVVHAVLLRDLPFPRPDRLVVIGEHGVGEPLGNVGYETFLDVRDRASSLDGFVIVRGWQPTLTSPSTIRLDGVRVSAGFFSTLGVRPALGRDFSPADDTPDTRYVVMLSDALWRRQFQADPSVIDRLIQINETEYRVIGVMPPDLEPVVSAHLYSAAEIWAPLGYARGGDSSCRSCRHLRALGSLGPGVAPEQALEELRGIHASLSSQYPADYGNESAGLERLADRVARPMVRPLSALFVAVLLVLAIAGANAASLMVARAADQEHEFALRTALGASRFQLLRPRTFEALLIAATAGVLGLAGGKALTGWLVSRVPATLPRADHIGLNGSVVLFTVAAVAVAAALIALLPLLQSARRSIGVGATSRSTGGRALSRAREALILADVAITLLLAIGAGAMVRSLDRLLRVDPGFETANVHTVGLSLVGPRWRTDDAVRQFQRDLIDQVRPMPGVEGVALTGQVPLGGNYDRRGGYLEEHRTGRAEDEVSFERYSVTPGYLSLMGIPLKRGRDLNDADRVGGERVMLINETAARTYWPGQDPIGRRAVFGGGDDLVTVVGIVGDVRHYQLDEAPNPQMYMPQTQMTDSYLVLVVKTTRFDDVFARVRETVRALGPDVPLYDVHPMSSFVAASAATRRFTATLLGMFAVIAGLMTVAGLYGVVAYAVSQRRREFGIRIALGAPKAGIGRLVLGRGAVLTGAGAVVGLLTAMPLTRLLGDQLYETSALDAGAVAVALVLLAATSALAHVVPIARATRVSPTIVLRGD